MSYLYGQNNFLSDSGLGCGPGCECAPCRGVGSTLNEWYERDEDYADRAKPNAAAPGPPAATANLKGWSSPRAGLGYAGLYGGTFAQVPATAPCPPTTCTPPATFLPSAHGFKFNNSFSVSIPLPLGLPPIGGAYGLCGGMTFAALDYFLACIPIPSATSPPAMGTPLYGYLLNRLLDSLGKPTFGMVLKFLEWTQRPDLSVPVPTPFGPSITIDGVQKLTVPEFHATVRSLSAGNKVPLGLVYEGPGSVQIWNNHQVLAYGATRVSPTITDIRIYDPNYHSDNGVSIRCELFAGGSHVRCVQRLSGGSTRRVRGFFRMPYIRRTPPCLP